jgi:hypothetical protein
MSASPPGAESWLAIGRNAATYTKTEAEAVLAGFAFGTTPLKWTPKIAPPTDQGLAGAPRATARFMWSYRTYDCVPNSPYAFGVTDLLTVAALDVRAGGECYLAIEAILPDLNEVLAHVDVAQAFWTLPHDDLGTKPPTSDHAAWWLWRAWALMMGLDGVGVAIAYKTLHRKRPWFFPIFDNDTVAKMGGEGAWVALHNELTLQEARFTRLEQWFAAEAAKRGGVPLTRLRIHDILLWGAGSEREALSRAGHQALG